MSKPERRPQRFAHKPDDVLRRMLNTPPKPHIAVPKPRVEVRKPKPKKPAP